MNGEGETVVGYTEVVREKPRAPKISVIVPVYKAEKYLRKCVDSLLAQTFRDFELLLVDDGSPDGSGAICDEYARRDSRVRVFHKENGGVSSARQYGLDQARGEYILQIDSDDWSEPQMLEEMYNGVKDTDCDMLIMSGYYLDKGSVSMKLREYYPMWSVEQISAGLLRRELVVGLWTKLIRTELFRNHNISFPVGVDFGEDAYVLCSLLLHAKKVIFIDKAYYHYCSSPNSLTSHRYTRKNFDSRFWWIGQLEKSFSGNDYLLNALSCMKVFVKEDAYMSGLYNQTELDKIYPEVNGVIAKAPLRFYRKCLLRLAVGGHASLARSIHNSALLQGGLSLVRWVKKRMK